MLTPFQGKRSGLGFIGIQLLKNFRLSSLIIQQKEGK